MGEQKRRAERIGDGPIDDAYRANMNAIAAVLDQTFNGDVTRGAERKVGFVLLVFPFGEQDDGRCNYISNAPIPGPAG